MASKLAVLLLRMNSPITQISSNWGEFLLAQEGNILYNDINLQEHHSPHPMYWFRKDDYIHSKPQI